MNRTTLNLIIDVVAFVGFVVLTTTGILLHFVLIPGSGQHSTIWNLNRHEWGSIHFGSALVFFFVLALHLILHWRWIGNVVLRRPREGSGIRVGLGIVGLTAIGALAISPLLTPIEKDLDSKGPSSFPEMNEQGTSIRGSMTLMDVEERTGVPVAHIVRSLKLPESVSPEERLGPLKRKYGFAMKDVREIVNKYKRRE